MSVIEIVKRQERERGLEQGMKQGKQIGLEQGKQLGLEQGIQKERAKAEAEKKSAAIKMLKNGFDVQLIADILGLSKEDMGV